MDIQKQLQNVEFTEVIPSGNVVRTVNGVSPTTPDGEIEIPADMPECTIEPLPANYTSEQLRQKINLMIKWMKNEIN